MIGDLENASWDWTLLEEASSATLVSDVLKMRSSATTVSVQASTFPTAGIALETLLGDAFEARRRSIPGYEVVGRQQQPVLGRPAGVALVVRWPGAVATEHHTVDGDRWTFATASAGATIVDPHQWHEAVSALNRLSYSGPAVQQVRRRESRASPLHQWIGRLPDQWLLYRNLELTLPEGRLRLATLPRQSKKWPGWSSEIDDSEIEGSEIEGLVANRGGAPEWPAYRVLMALPLAGSDLENAIATTEQAPIAQVIESVRACWDDRPGSTVLFYTTLADFELRTGVERLSRLPGNALESVAVEAVAHNPGELPQGWESLLVAAQEATISPGAVRATSLTQPDKPAPSFLKDETSTGMRLTWRDATSEVQTLKLGRRLLGDLLGGGFGTLYEASADGRPMVVKVASRTGGSRKETFAPAVVLRDLCIQHTGGRGTRGQAETNHVLEVEHRILTADQGILFPGVFGVGTYETLDRGLIANVYAMELLRGRRPQDLGDVASTLEAIADAVERGVFDFHGDLKPEHIFIEESSRRVRLIDPAPRMRGHVVGFTPEFNPHCLSGPFADVYCAAAIAYELIAAVNPHGATLMERMPTLDGPPTPVERSRDVDREVSILINSILAAPYERKPADWMHSQREAAQRFRAAI